METKNAKIESTHLGFEDHGCFTFYLTLEHEDGMQSAGGYVLGNKKGIDLIKKILEIVRVEKWEELKGNHIRIKSDKCKIYEIGNFMKNEWLNFENFFTQDE